jgi:hypothetical protein
VNFAINLDGDLSAKANADADALQKLNDALRAEQKALRGMESQMRALQKASVVDIGLHRQLSAAIQAQKNSIAGLTAQQVSYGSAAFEAGDATEQETTKSAALASMIGNVLAIAFTKLAGAIMRAVSSIYEFAEARGDTERMLETVFRSQEAAEHTYDVIRNISGRIAISQSRAMQVADNLAAAGMVIGDRMVASIEAVGKAEAARKGAGQVIEGIITRSQRSRWFSVSRDELLKSGLTFQDLAKTISKKTGQGMQEAVAALRVGRVDLKTGLEALNQTIEERLGKIAAKKFLTIGYQATRLKETFGNLFAKVDTSRLAAIMDRVSTWLDTSSVGGAALGEIFNAAFDALGDAIEAVWPYAQTFFEFLLLTSLKVYNAFYPLRKALKEMFVGADIASFEDALLGLSDVVANVATAAPWVLLGMAIGRIGMVLWSVTAALWAAAPAVWAFVSPFLVAAAPFIAFGLAVYGIYLAFKNIIELAKATDWEFVWGKIVEGFAPVLEWFQQLDLGELAGDLIDGLTNGITNHGEKFVSAMRNLGQKGLMAFKSFFGIASPSKLMEQQGAFLDAGLEKGVAANSNGPSEALADATGYQPPGSAGAASNSVAPVTNSTDNSQTRGNTVVFSEGAIVITLGGGVNAQAAEQIRAEMPQIMADIFEQMGYSMGAEKVT